MVVQNSGSSSSSSSNAQPWIYDGTQAVCVLWVKHECKFNKRARAFSCVTRMRKKKKNGRKNARGRPRRRETSRVRQGVNGIKTSCIKSPASSSILSPRRAATVERSLILFTLRPHPSASAFFHGFCSNCGYLRRDFLREVILLQVTRKRSFLNYEARIIEQLGFMNLNHAGTCTPLKSLVSVIS